MRSAKRSTSRGYTRYVGRTGALAVALGVGLAVANTPGVAWAAPESVDNLDAPGAPGSTKIDGDTTTEPVKTQSTVSITTDHRTETESTPVGQSLPETNKVAQSTTATTQTSPIAPNVVFRSSGGALTSERYAFPLATRWQSPLKPRSNVSTPPPTDIPKPESDPTSIGLTTTPSAATKSAGAQQNFRSPVTTKMRARNVGPTSVGTLDSTVEDTAALKRSSVATEKPGAQTNTAQTTAFSVAAHAPPPAKADPIAAVLAVPATITATARGLVAAVLAPLLTPTPGAPAQSPLMWTVLAFVRRQFFNETPRISPVVSAPNALGDINVSLDERDADGDRLVYSATDGAKGTVTLNPDGHSFTYTPKTGETGTDTITVSVTDATNAHIHGPSGLINALSLGRFGDSGHTSVNTVTVRLNTPPDVTATPGEPDDATGTVIVKVVAKDPDGDALTVTVAPPARSTGTVGAPTLVDKATGTYEFTYTPSDSARHAASADDATDELFDRVTVSVSDGHGASLTRDVVVSIDPDNDAPEFSKVTPITDVATGKVTGTIVFTDADAGDQLTYSGGGKTDKGNVTVDATGTFTYTPDDKARYTATATAGDDSDTFTVIVTDGHGGNVPHIVTVDVTPLAATTNPTAALDAAQAVVVSTLAARAGAQAEMATLVSALPAVTATGADLYAMMALLMVDLAATRAADPKVAADGKKAIETKLGEISDEDLAAIEGKATKIAAAEAALTVPLAAAQDANAAIAAAAAADGTPVYSRLKDVVVDQDGSATGTVVFVDPNGDPLSYVIVGNVLVADAPTGIPSPGSASMNYSTGAFTYAPGGFIGTTPPEAVTFLVYANDGEHIGAYNVVVDVTPTPVPTTVAEAETSVADAEVDLNAAIAAFTAAYAADPNSAASILAIEKAAAAAIAKFSAVQAAASLFASTPV